MNDQTMKTHSPAKSPSENVTPTYPIPLPSFPTHKGAYSDKEIDAYIAQDLLNVGWLNLLAMQAKPDAPEWLKKFDPLSGHRPEDELKYGYGSSRFLAKAIRPDGALPLIEDGVAAWVGDGHGGADKALTVTVQGGDSRIGEWFPHSWKPHLVVRKVHGCLQPVLELPESTSAGCWTFVLTNEGPDGWCLASCYPGKPDPEPDREGLNEGDEISLEEANRRGLRIKVG